MALVANAYVADERYMRISTTVLKVIVVVLVVCTHYRTRPTVCAIA